MNTDVFPAVASLSEERSDSRKIRLRSQATLMEAHYNCKLV